MGVSLFQKYPLPADWQDLGAKTPEEQAERVKDYRQYHPDTFSALRTAYCQWALEHTELSTAGRTILCQVMQAPLRHFLTELAGPDLRKLEKHDEFWRLCKMCPVNHREFRTNLMEGELTGQLPPPEGRCVWVDPKIRHELLKLPASEQGATQLDVDLV